jgi:predicted Zn-dependent protease
MIRSISRRALLALAALFLVACVKTPVTGRRALVLLPLEQEMQLGQQAYTEILKEEDICQDAQATEVVKRVGQSIASATKKQGWPWEFKVIDAPDTLNAFALPGGKVAIYTGILQPAQNEAGLATIMAHEVAHAIARHGGQRVSQDMLIGLGLQAADLTLGDVKHHDLIMAGLGLGAQVGVQLPYSRKMETEADTIGLTLMARAGYDPREAIEFWKRFQKATSGAGKPPEFLSTHPPTGDRIENLKEHLPEALEIYEKSKKVGKGVALTVPSGC